MVLSIPWPLLILTSTYLMYRYAAIVAVTAPAHAANAHPPVNIQLTCNATKNVMTNAMIVDKINCALIRICLFFSSVWLLKNNAKGAYITVKIPANNVIRLGSCICCHDGIGINFFMVDNMMYYMKELKNFLTVYKYCIQRLHTQ